MPGLISISQLEIAKYPPRGSLVVGSVLEFCLRRTKRGATLTFLNILFPKKVSLFWDRPCLSVGFCLWASVFFNLRSLPAPFSVHSEHIHRVSHTLGRSTEEDRVTKSRWEAFLSVLKGNSKRVPWVHVTLLQPAKPRSDTLAKAQKAKPLQASKSVNNNVWTPIGV